MVKGLQKLTPTKIVNVPDRVQFKSGKTMAKWYVEAGNLSKEQRALVRSKTFPGIAKAMAEQWGNCKTNDRYKYLMETHSFPSISDMYNDKCFCCPADRPGNRCCGEKWCAETWKRYEAITNPEWHHVSLSTLANIDFNMLDEKRQTYFTIYRDLQQTLSHLRNCKTVNTYSACYNRFVKRLNVIWEKSKITNAMYKYIEAKLSMQNVESGLWSSAWEAAVGCHESRRYNKCRA